VNRLRLFPLNTVLFPGAVLNLHVFEPRYKQMISECLEGGEAFGVCLIREGDEAGDPDVHAVRDRHDGGDRRRDAARKRAATTSAPSAGGAFASSASSRASRT
jgi:hypothetical protein